MLIMNSVFGVLPDCDLVNDLARGFNMHLAQPTRMLQLQIDCCSEASIACNTRNVISIQWRGFNLNGTIAISPYPY